MQSCRHGPTIRLPLRKQTSPGFRLIGSKTTDGCSILPTRDRFRPTLVGLRESVMWCRGHRQLVDLLLHALPIGRAQLVLLELAGRSACEFGAKLHRRRALVVGNQLTAVIDQIALSGL
jgi:hypothetical protein